MVMFRYINDKNSNVVIRDLKIELFVKILIVEKKQLSEIV